MNGPSRGLFLSCRLITHITAPTVTLFEKVFFEHSKNHSIHLLEIHGKLENKKPPSPCWLICNIIQVDRGRAVSYFRVFHVYQPAHIYPELPQYAIKHTIVLMSGTAVSGYIVNQLMNVIIVCHQLSGPSILTKLSGISESGSTS